MPRTAADPAVRFLGFRCRAEQPCLGRHFTWDPSQVIPGTQGITPGPSIDLSDWNTPGHQLEFANLQNANLTNAPFFATSDLTSPDFGRSTLTNVNFTGAIVKGADFGGTTALPPANSTAPPATPVAI